MTVSALKRVSIGAALLVALSAFLLIAGWNIATPGLYYDELLFVDAALGGPNGIFKHISFGSLPVMLASVVGSTTAALTLRAGRCGGRRAGDRRRQQADCAVVCNGATSQCHVSMTMQTPGTSAQARRQAHQVPGQRVTHHCLRNGQHQRHGAP